MNSTFAQGSLTPFGPPAPSMKTLQQIEPRTPISSLPFTISTPGSYYLTGSLESTNSGITVSANNVTIDLMGFTIGGAQDTNHPGIHVAGATNVMRNVIIRNGMITRFGIGILIENTQGGRVHDVAIHQNTAEGIWLRSNDPGVCSDVTIEHCSVTENASYGIFARSETVSRNCRGHTIRNNQISGNYARGVVLIRSEGCVVDGNTFGPQVPVVDFGAFAVFTGDGRNLVIRNFEHGNTNGFGFAYFRFNGSDTFGPLIDVTGYLPSTNTAASPWANFSR
ncbi:MAG TPA: right-handed parallel beta-helix repeat-containing protein [Verrucomicrobiae bacterium]|nr:right-handed parallel beta-helix repeat-containing protein [Verrucomicrobiae bacterium]